MSKLDSKRIYVKYGPEDHPSRWIELRNAPMWEETDEGIAARGGVQGTGYQCVQVVYRGRNGHYVLCERRPGMIPFETYSYMYTEQVVAWFRCNGLDLPDDIARYDKYSEL